MGIPCYFVTMVRKYPKMLREAASFGRVDNLYLDANSIVYDSIRRVESEDGRPPSDGEVIAAVEAQIRVYMAEVRPQRRVLIAFDGVAPRAKTAQQRERRYRSAQERLALSGASGWDTCKITPGTPFMCALMETLEQRMVQRPQGKGPSVELSSSAVAGEGEHKIFARIRDQATYHAKTRTLVYGLDADLMMLAVLHAGRCAALGLYRETPHFIRSVAKGLDPSRSYVLDAAALAARLRAETHGSHEDYVVACFLLGNDFLPHFPSLSLRDDGHAIVIAAYKTLAKQRKGFRLVRDGRLCWAAIRDLIKALAAGETAGAAARHRRTLSREGRPMKPRTGETRAQARLTGIPTSCCGLERYIAPGEPGWRSRYCEELLECDLSSPRLKALSWSYLQGLEWTHAYYTRGCKDWAWSYPSHYAPPLSELVKAVPDFDMELLPVRTRTEEDVDALHALVRVIPATSAAVVPAGWEARVAAKDERAEHVWAFSRYMWEGSVLFADERVARVVAVA